MAAKIIKLSRTKKRTMPFTPSARQVPDPLIGHQADYVSSSEAKSGYRTTSSELHAVLPGTTGTIRMILRHKSRPKWLTPDLRRKLVPAYDRASRKS